ncbi:MAG TPA: hypothetical protein VFU36_01945 [Jatrophihabitans sp.]|nr:hypothetical protein [Jatrophihabitans sp.]
MTEKPDRMYGLTDGEMGRAAAAGCRPTSDRARTSACCCSAPVTEVMVENHTGSAATV